MHRGRSNVMGVGRHRWHQALLAVGLAIWAVAPSEVLAQSLYVIPTESPASQVDESQPLRVVLHARDPQGLAKVLGVEPPVAGNDALPYVLDGYAVIHGTPERSWLESTFVMDYQDSRVAKLSADFKETLGGKRPPDAAMRPALVAFAAKTLKSTQNRGFDIASEVATRREGDCTEYAVLTAALARAEGIPARVVLGLALIHGPKQYGAFGHAWAEFKVDGHWLVADAALWKQAYPVRYLPFGVLENEGMGFTMEVARLTPVWVQRVEVLGGPVSKGVTR